MSKDYTMHHKPAYKNSETKSQNFDLYQWFTIVAYVRAWTMLGNRKKRSLKKKDATAFVYCLSDFLVQLLKIYKRLSPRIVVA
jgi:hypothetical protein